MPHPSLVGPTASRTTTAVAAVPPPLAEGIAELGLSSPRTRVLLIGTGHSAGPQFPETPAIRSTVEDLEACLVRHCGVAPASLRTVVDPATPKEMSDLVWQQAAEAEDVLLLYFAGHGALSARRELHLATGATHDLTEGRPADQALAFSEINDALVARCAASTVIVILDCCYSGRARLEIPGDSLFLASAAATTPALAPPGARHTLFTGELIRLIKEGDEHGRPRLTLGRIVDVLSRRLPRAQQPTIRFEGRARHLVLTRNRGYAEPAVVLPEAGAAADGTGAAAGLEGAEEASPY